MDLESSIASTLSGKIKKLLEEMLLLDSDITSNVEYILHNYASQVLHVVHGIYRTNRIESAIKQNSVVIEKERQHDNVSRLAQLARKYFFDPSTAAIICNMIIYDIYYRDVLEALEKHKVTDTVDFLWQGIFRSYVAPPEVISAKPKSSLAFTAYDNIIFKMFNQKLSYQYELKGSMSRLVITPLTERCYTTMFTAIRFCYSCLLCGPV
jgi:dynein heavy chain